MLSGDVERFRELAKKKDLTTEDFHYRDQDMLLRMAAPLLPRLEVREVNGDTGEVAVYEKPDYDKLPGMDEVSLVRFLKDNKKI